MNRYSALMTTAMAALVIHTAHAQTGAIVEPITAPVSTAFGIYTPYAIPQHDIRIGLSEPTISSDFSNVESAGGDVSWNEYFNADERLLLRKNNFVARSEPFGTFAQAYAGESSEGFAPFVTVDAVLHGLRITTDEAYRQMERDRFAPTLDGLLNDLARNLAAQLGGEQNQTPAEALTKLLAYIQTAQALLKPSTSLDSRVASQVRAELQKINAAAGVDRTSIFPDKRIDYARFEPRGHYATTESLRNYYRARTWLSEIGFDLNAAEGSDPNQARLAILMARAMDAEAGRGDFRRRYLSISEPIAFFDGRSAKDVNWEMLAGALRGFYGPYGMQGSVAADNAEVTRFVRYLADQLPGLDIRSTSRSLRMLSRNESIDEALWAAAKGSASPGMAIMASFGAERAESPASVTKRIRNLFVRHPAEDWVQDLQWSMLYTASGMMGNDEESAGYPRFMRTDAWRDRQIVSAIGAWTDFRHEPSILAPTRGTVKVAATASASSDGYVEPDPRAWSRIASLARYIRDGIDGQEFGALVDKRIADKLRDIENTAAHMMRIAAYELQGTPLSSEQRALIASMSARIAAYETFVDESLREPGLAIAAGTVEESSGTAPANGHPLAIYAIVPTINGSLMLTRGAIYSYYETDQSNEEWVRDITAQGSTPIKGTALMRALAGPNVQAAQDAGSFRPVTAALPAAVSYTLTSAERRRVLPDVRIDMESNVVRRSVGELWFTVHAPQLNGAEVVIVAVDETGNVVHRSTPTRIERGERYDMIPVDDMKSGQYFVRVIDTFDRTLASGRFMVVR